jgi:hypothetical protein
MFEDFEDRYETLHTNNGIEYRIKKEFKEYRDKIILEDRIINAQLPIFIKTYTINNYIGQDKNKNLIKVNKYIQEFKTKYKNIHLYFYSDKNSTQKTTIASYIGKELLRQNITVKFVLMSDLINDLKNYDFDNKAKENIDKIEDIELLIIDDCFDLKKMTIYNNGYQLGFIDNYLRKRIENNKLATIFTSNINIEDINKGFGISLQALIKRNVEILEFKDSIEELENKLPNKSIWD